MGLRSASVVLLFSLVLTAGARDTRIDDQQYYRLTNSYLGYAYSLDTTPDAPHVPVMAKSGEYAGQYWKFTSHDGCYRMTNALLGAGKSLDTYSDGGNNPFMGPSGTYSGQCWHLTPVGDGYVRLTNDFLGNSRSLDTHSEPGHKPCMADSGDYSGQLWKLTKGNAVTSFH